MLTGRIKSVLFHVKKYRMGIMKKLYQHGKQAHIPFLSKRCEIKRQERYW